MSGTCFSSNLGARAVQCNPQDVTGTQRYRFFATALTNHHHQQHQQHHPQGDHEFKSNQKQKIQQKSSSSSSSQQSQGDQEKDDINYNSFPPPLFQSSGTQTDEVKTILISPYNNDNENNKNNQSKNTIKQKSKIQLEKIAREKERKEQEAALPPVTDKASLEQYTAFLEENEKKDFALREKELDEKMKQKLKDIEENLYDRYTKDSALNKEKVELIRNTKMASLKRKESALQRERISDISNNQVMHTDLYTHMQSKRQQENVPEDTISFDMRMHSNVKVEKRQSRRGKIRIRKKQEDLDLITSCFEKYEYS